MELGQQQARYSLPARNGIKCKASIWFPNTKAQKFSIF